MKQSPEQRFLAKIEIDANTQCWNWTHCKNQYGYGRFRLNGKTLRAHRWAYEQYVGIIPEGLVLDHFVCNNRGCVNPAHLRAVTARENALRGNTTAATNLAKTACPQGHTYDEENTHVTPRGRRECRTCRRESSRILMRARYWRNKSCRAVAA